MSVFGVGRDKGIDSFTHVPGRKCIEPPESLPPQYAKPAFHLVEPRGMSRSVMEVDVGMLDHPAVMLGLVGIKVVQDDMEFPLRIMSNKLIHKVQKLPPAPVRVMAHLNKSRGDFQGGKEGSGAMPFILMAESSQRLPIRKPQPSLGALQCLDGRFLIHSNDNRIIGGIKVQPDNISSLLGKLRVGTHAPAMTSLQMDAVPSEHSPNMVGRNISQSLGHQTPGPGSIAGRRRCVQLCQYTLLSRRVIFSRLARPRRIAQPSQSVTIKPGAPFTYRGSTQLQHESDLLARFSPRAF